MKVLHVNIGYPPFLGGSQFLLQRVARGLADRGYDTEVWTSTAREVEALWKTGKGELGAGSEMDGKVMVRRFPVRRLPLAPYAYHGLRRLAMEADGLPWLDKGWLWRLARYTPWLPELPRAFAGENADPDLVHGWNIPFESLLEPAFRFARRRGVPFVVTPLIHLGEAGEDNVRRRYTMRHQMALLRESDAIIALTDLEADYLAEEGVAPERLHVISGGVDVEAISRGDAQRFREAWGISAPFVLFVGSLNPHKGAACLLEAMIHLWKDGASAELVMIGQAMEPFHRFYAALGAEWQARCHLLGTVSEAEKQDALAACELLALPSRTESFGLVYLEAWAAGKPVIGARAGAVPVVIEEGVDGLLVPFGDEGVLARAIASLLADEEWARSLGHAGRQKVRERYSWDQVIDETEQVYQRLLGAAP